MNNCIFSAHCTEHTCDRSCPIFTETSYLLERNNLAFNNRVFSEQQGDIDKALSILDKSSGTFKAVVAPNNTIEIANLITYCGICKYWQGNRLHCDVYNLKYANHVESIQKSWSSKGPLEQLEYEQIWISSAKVLIISNIDYIQFKDFQSQTLLNIIHSRRSLGLTTILISPKPENLVGASTFLNSLKSLINEAVIQW